MEIKGFIIAEPDRLESSAMFSTSATVMLEYGYIVIQEHTLTFELPADFNPVAAEVAAIEKKLDSMADDYHKKVWNLKERIESLLCIEMSPTAEVPSPQAPMSSDIYDDDFPF